MKGLRVKVVMDGEKLVVGVAGETKDGWTEVKDERGGSDEWPSRFVFLALKND